MPIQVYILHNVADNRFLEQIEKSLVIPIRNNIIEIKHSNSIYAGQEIKEVTKQYLDAADVVVALCSSDLYSDETTYNFFEQALEYKEKLIIPILLRYFDWQGTKLQTLPNFLPKNKEPILANIEGDIDKAFYQTEKVFYETIQDFLAILQDRFKDKINSSQVELSLKLKPNAKRINTKIYRIIRNYLDENKTYTQALFALEYPSSLSFLEKLTSAEFIHALKMDNILEKEGKEWRVDFRLSEYLRDDFKLSSVELNSVTQKAINIFKEDLQDKLDVGEHLLKKTGYSIQDLFNVIHLLFRLYDIEGYRSVEDEIINAFSYINFRRNHNPLSIEKLLNDLLLYIYDFKISIIDRIKTMNNFVSGLDTLGHYEKALKYLQLSLDASKDYIENQQKQDETSEVMEKECVKIHELYGSIYYEMGEFNKSIKSYKNALDLNKKLKERESLKTAILYQNLARPFYRLGGKKRKNSIKLLENALDECDKQISEDPKIQQLKATMNANLAVFHEGMGNYQESINYQFRALQEKEKIYGEEHHSVAMSLHNLGTLYLHMGNFQLALDNTLKALEIRQKTLGEKHPHTLTTQFNLSSIYLDLGYLEESNILLEKLISGYKNSKTDENYWYILDTFGRLYVKKMLYEKALDCFEQALKGKVALYGEHFSSQAVYAHETGVVYFHQKNYAKALERYEEALILYAYHLDRESIEVAVIQYLKGKVYLKLKQYDKALEELNKSLQIREKKLSDIHPDLANTHSEIAKVYRLQKKYEEAIKHNEKALKIFLRNRDKKNILQPLSYTIDAYIKSKQFDSNRLVVHLNMLSQSKDIETYSFGKETLIKLDTFDNFDVQTILEHDLCNKSSVNVFFEEMGVIQEKIEASVEESYGDVLDELFEGFD